jgi:hypothetical protein
VFIINKSFDELATEITVAWINAVGQSCAVGKFSGDWLKVDTVKDAYAQFYETIIETARNASK